MEIRHRFNSSLSVIPRPRIPGIQMVRNIARKCRSDAPCSDTVARYIAIPLISRRGSPAFERRAVTVLYLPSGFFRFWSRVALHCTVEGPPFRRGVLFSRASPLVKQQPATLGMSSSQGAVVLRVPMSAGPIGRESG